MPTAGGSLSRRWREQWRTLAVEFGRVSRQVCGVSRVSEPQLDSVLLTHSLACRVRQQRSTGVKVRQTADKSFNSQFGLKGPRKVTCSKSQILAAHLFCSAADVRTTLPHQPLTCAHNFLLLRSFYAYTCAPVVYETQHFSGQISLMTLNYTQASSLTTFTNIQHFNPKQLKTCI